MPALTAVGRAERRLPMRRATGWPRSRRGPPLVLRCCPGSGRDHGGGISLGPCRVSVTFAETACQTLGRTGTEVVADVAAVAFGLLAWLGTAGLAGKAREVLQPRIGTVHAAVIRYATVMVGIAAQQSLSNLSARLVLLFARPVNLGDQVLIKSGALGGELCRNGRRTPARPHPSRPPGRLASRRTQLRGRTRCHRAVTATARSRLTYVVVAARGDPTGQAAISAVKDSRGWPERWRSARAAACAPHMPCAPGPGGVAAEQMKWPGTPTS